MALPWPHPTCATRLRLGGADPAQVQALLGHDSLESTARYFRANAAEQAAVIERIFEYGQPGPTEDH